ncbi:alanine--tRNA ligase [bacterium CPR1]|nr:alanine--tRNA ligase [bacterium CPR1]
MKGAEIRQSFLDFFKERGHDIVPSAPVVPHDDPTLLFTNAGMNQFKPFFLGQATPANRRIADTQKCIRVSGKHNDLEEVGHDTYHHTFFEMLGNWSIGDYYKSEAISWAWELLTKVWKIPKQRLHATVFGGDEQVPADEEAVSLWQEVTDIDHGHIHRFGRKDNFWMMGETGPCGPCSEIHIDLTPDCSGGKLVNAGSPLVMELWNLVFIQFNAEEGGGLRELPAKHVDTGMGLERVAAVMECTAGCKDFQLPISNYDTEIFQPIVRELVLMSGCPYAPGQSEDEHSIAMRVCADHIRMVSFSIADGALPSNEGRGYVVRRLLRRAARYGRKLGFKEPFLWKLVSVLDRTMGDAFPEVRREREKLERILKAEEESFNQTLDRGLSLFQEEAEKVEGKSFPGHVAFKLYDTFGFPRDLTEVLARERGLEVDAAAFEALMAEQKLRARSAKVKTVVSAVTEELNLAPTPFTGFTRLEESTRVLQRLGNEVILERTPFYGEMGGQVGDTGILRAIAGDFRVSETRKQEGVVLHHVEGPGLQIGDEVRAVVDRDRRLAVERHHTATHILHNALRQVLGSTVRQQGSLVAPDRLRFDFTHYEAVRPGELRAIERLINEHILANEGVSWFEIPYDQRPDSVIAFFGDKYGKEVRVVKIGGLGVGELPEPAFDGYSMELCGGTHTLRTGQLGPFRFVHESAIAAGVRRVEAVCGLAAVEAYERDREILENLCRRLTSPPAELERRLEQLLESQKKLEKELETLRLAAAGSQVGDLLSQQKEVEGVPVLAVSAGDGDAEYLRKLADALRPKFHGVAVLGATSGGKVSLLALVDKELTKKGLHAGNLIREVARQVGGGGGGRPDLAEAGGKDPSRLEAALASVGELVKGQKNG